MIGEKKYNVTGLLFFSHFEIYICEIMFENYIFSFHIVLLIT